MERSYCHIFGFHLFLCPQRCTWHSFPASTGPPPGRPFVASPILDIAIEPLQKILKRVTNDGILSQLSSRHARFHVSLCADDVALFINPVRSEVDALHSVLAAFGDVSGLRTSFSESTSFHIHCSNLDINGILASFLGDVGSLPCSYLGLPRSIRKPSKIQIQPAKLAGWKGKLMAKAGCLALINSVLTSITTYFMTISQPSKWGFKRFEKIGRSPLVWR